MEIIIKDTPAGMSRRKYEGYLKWAEIVQWGRKNPISFIEHFFGIYFLDFQKYVFLNSWTTPYVLLAMSRNAGKAVNLDTKVYSALKYDESKSTRFIEKTIGDLKVGDIIYDDSGKLTEVIHLNPIVFEEVYQIEFEDGEIIEANAEHLWEVYDENKDFSSLKNTDFIYTYIKSNEFYVRMSVFQLEEKYGKLKGTVPKDYKFKQIIDVRKTNIKKAMRCITVSNDTGLFVCGDKYTVTHNSFLSAPLIMAKSMLFPSHKTFILAGTAAQSQNTFKKIEQTAKKQIESATGLTDVFISELVKTNSSSDGFNHNPSSYHCELFNSSEITSLSGAYDRNRGYRSNLNFYDESGFSPFELFHATDPFLTQNSSAKYGSEEDEIDNELAPLNIPNQRILASSASSVDTHFYELYKEYSIQMFMGNRDYFVADINCDLLLKPTMRGKPTTPLLTQETINLEMRRNPEKAMREYYNIFTRDGGDKQAIKRAVIMRNCEKYLPVFYNEGGKTYVFAYDPARSHDNSVVTIAELYFDENVGYKMKIVNCVSFSDIMKKKRTPIRTPEQVLHIKQMLLDYNGQQAADYENIECFLIDSGSGGAGVTIGDYFMEDWVDTKGIKHKGLIDEIENAEELYNFPDAVNKIKLMSPTKWKVKMYDALIEMLSLDLITFPLEYDNKDTFTIQVEDKEKTTILSDDEKLAFIQIDLLKEELVNIYRFDGTNGNHRYDLSPEKETKMHDDRAYTMAMLGWFLQEVRRENIVNPKREFEDDFETLAGFAMLF